MMEGNFAWSTLDQEEIEKLWAAESPYFFSKRMRRKSDIKKILFKKKNKKKIEIETARKFRLFCDQKY